ncbi:Sugar/inositol transporter [Cordyceps fumosorosea ARSEF 2679]|uniref:Sugar/inositol transporter n=1 Tax=Cordyceps fumosorosea (strain ARSEF 2679) TaxID=1081104 RepID=A0A168D6P4_CORFA|nr:Sugar/inositol transporter [Cordyceps fumosorosea ARSEF 2679]OAA72233.1 Sugar/inositol transporter [Cordyceps fumosorosea ARSEF 2679]
MVATIQNVYIAAALATIGGLLQGFDVSSLSAILATPQYKEYFSHPDSSTQGGITASMAGGSLLGALLASWMGDRIGRRDSMAVACIVFITGSTLMCAVQNTAMLVVARVVNGSAVGILTSQGPIYIAEISPATTRGRLISLQQWMVTWGILIMYYISYGASFIKSNASFRLPWGIQMVPAILLLCAVPFLPRSPRWLASKERWEEASKTLALLRSDGDESDEAVISELEAIRSRIRLESMYGSSSWAQVFSGRNLIRVHVCIFAHLWAQFSGTNALMYYIVYVFQMAGLSGTKVLAISSIQYVINVAMTLPALLLVDKMPRRRVMMTGSFLMATWMFATAAVEATHGYGVPGGLNGNATITWVVNSSAAGKAVIALSYLFVATFACTWGPMGWIYPSEIIPLYIRSKAVSLSVLVNWLGNFSLTFMTPPAFQEIQWRTYLIFGSISAAALVHVFLFFQETQGKTLEQMNDVFDYNTFAFGRIRQPPEMVDASGVDEKLSHEI